MKQGMSADEADDHWTEHGDKTPMEVYSEEQEKLDPRGPEFDERRKRMALKVDEAIERGILPGRRICARRDAICPNGMSCQEPCANERYG